MDDPGRPLVEVKDLKMHFPIFAGVFKRQVGEVRAVDGLTLDIRNGETLGLVGESGCGKSTVGRAILRLYAITDGRIVFEGKDISSASEAELKRTRPAMQMVFQDPQACLNPRMTVSDIISEPLIEHTDLARPKRHERVRELMNSVGLNPSFMNRYPHEFSGGQRQRIGIARALALNPKFIVCDEPIAALDVSIQAQVINLLEDLQAKLGLTYLFISHDLSVIRHMAGRVAVMYLGKVVELADRNDLYDNPLHPYTQALLSAVPEPDPIVESERDRIILSGDVPSPSNPPTGCNFCTRCPSVMDVCRTTEPPETRLPDGRKISCHLFTENGETGSTSPSGRIMSA